MSSSEYNSYPASAKLTSGGFKAKAFQKAEKALRWQILEKSHYTKSPGVTSQIFNVDFEYLIING
jgi:hypothetical protein